MAGYRPIYTVQEDTAILNFIVESKGYYKVKGKIFWMDLSNSGIIDRTWQSLKERFEKAILPRINNARYAVSPMEKKNIEVACYQMEHHFDTGGGGGEEIEDSDDEEVNVDDQDVPNSS